MKPPPFAYVRAGSAADAVAHLAELGDDAKLIAGGQSLVPLLNLRLARPAALVDIGHLDELSYVAVDDDGLQVGATTTQVDVERSSLATRACPLLPVAVGHIGHLQIRNRGTIGGSIAHADPAAELPLVLLVTDGSVRLRSARGTRTVTAADFFDGVFTTATAPDELVERLTFTALPPSAGWAFHEHARRPGDFAVAAVAVVLEVVDGVVAGGTRVAVSGVADRPLRLPAIEDAIVGLDPRSPELRQAVADVATGLDGLDGHDDLFVSSRLRRRIVTALLDRCLVDAAERAAA